MKLAQGDGNAMDDFSEQFVKVVARWQYQIRDYLLPFVTCCPFVERKQVLSIVVFVDDVFRLFCVPSGLAIDAVGVVNNACEILKDSMRESNLKQNMEKLDVVSSHFFL